MRGLHKMVVTGAMGGLAAATIAASGAFACSPQTRMEVTGAKDGAVVPGQTVDIKVTIIDSEQTGGEIEVTWWSTRPDQQLDVLIPRSPSKTYVGTTKTVTIPTTPGRADAPYAIVARQYRADDPSVRMTSVSSMVWVAPPAAAPKTDDGPAVVSSDATLSRANGAPGTATANRPDGTRAPAGTPAPGVNAPAGSNGASVVAGAPAPSQTDPALTPQPASAPTQQATATFGQPGTSPALAAEPARSASPTSADLWSGLDADKAPSLLDTPVATSDSRAPMGAILLGAGVIALAGVALAATRRRLAVVTRR